MAKITIQSIGMERNSDYKGKRYPLTAALELAVFDVVAYDGTKAVNHATTPKVAAGIVAIDTGADYGVVESGDPFGIMAQGRVKVDTAKAAGTKVYVSDTAGELSDTEPASNAQQVGVYVYAHGESTSASTIVQLDFGKIDEALAGVTSTVTELNTTDLSAQTETIDSGVAASAALAHTLVDNTVTGAGAITLAAPDASMVGRIKTIEMTVDGGDLTLALTNVQGGTAATTATFDAVGEALILIGASNGKWTVLKEMGVTLS